MVKLSRRRIPRNGPGEAFSRHTANQLIVTPRVRKRPEGQRNRNDAGSHREATGQSSRGPLIVSIIPRDTHGIWNWLQQCPLFHRGRSRSFQPLVETVPTAPPALETPNPTVEGRCGTCGAVLMRVDEGKVYPLMVLCLSCGSYNLTDA